jgi:hypothetical protein
MTATGNPRVRPIRDRSALLERQDELAAAAAAIDEEQRSLAVEFTRLRRELAEVRELLWPSDDGRLFAKARRPPMAGPAPIPPPVVDAVPLRGRALRDAALRVLLDADEPLQLAEIHRALLLGGNVLPARDPVKQLGDALGYEERRGVVRRIARGMYRIGTLTPYRRRVLRERR